MGLREITTEVKSPSHCGKQLEGHEQRKDEGTGTGGQQRGKP